MKNRRLAAFAAAMLFLLPLVYPQEIVPALATSSSVLLEENGSVRVSPGVFYKVSINLSIPSSTPYQQVQPSQEPKIDSEGNSYLPISATGPDDYFFYSRQVAVQTSARTTPLLPATFTVPVEYAKYLQSTNRTQSSDPEIRKAAQEATVGAKTPFEKIAKLAMFVNRQITYDASYVGQQKDARWVLENRRGVCVEYSTLFVALARASGIPARYVNGYSYSDRFQGWMGHAWAEVYIGEWVPVDPTWFEAGSLDALHVEAGKYAELSTDATLSASVSSQYSKIKWDSGGKGGALAHNIQTLQLLSEEADDGYSLTVSAASIPLNGTATVSMTILGRDYRVMPLTLLSCTGESQVDVENGSQYILLEPGRNTTITWKITAPEYLDSRYTYECPLALNSPYLSHKIVSVKIDPRAGKTPAGASDVWNAIQQAAQNTDYPPGSSSDAAPQTDSSPSVPASRPAPCLPSALISILAILILFAKN